MTDRKRPEDRVEIPGVVFPAVGPEDLARLPKAAPGTVLECSRCGYQLLRPEDAQIRVWLVSPAELWAGAVPRYACKHASDCDRRIRDRVAGRRPTSWER